MTSLLSNDLTDEWNTNNHTKPPLFPYHLMEISKVNFKSKLDYISLCMFLEDGFNESSYDHKTKKDSSFGYECSFIYNFDIFLINVNIFTACFNDGYIIEIILLKGQPTSYEIGINHLLKKLNVTLESPLYVRMVTSIHTSTYVTPNPIEWEIDIINYFLSLIDLNKSSESMIQQGLTLIGQYISDPSKNYLFINDNYGVKLMKEIGVVCMSDCFQITNIPILSMLIFTEFINIKESSNEIIRDIILHYIPNFMKNTCQHLNRVTLGTILAICKRDITFMDYFKQTIHGVPCYITHLRSIIKCEIESRDICSALYAKKILNML
jgi:hypothetical protein